MRKAHRFSNSQRIRNQVAAHPNLRDELEAQRIRVMHRIVEGLDEIIRPVVREILEEK